MKTRVQLGRYRLIAELGHGGMADVYLSVIQGPSGSGFTKLAVIKRLRENLAEDTDFITMLMDEARITARLQHPNVVQMLEVGQDEGEFFLAMEYLDGQPLHRVLRRATRLGRVLPESFHVLTLRDALEGLHYAHELTDYDGRPLGIIHRDMTPQNLFVTYDGHVKVMDFGIAKAAGRSGETKQGVVKGKIRYMAPEQAMASATLDRRADIFSAGVLLWEAIVGRPFWQDIDELAIVQMLLEGRYQPSPRAVRPDVSEALDAICRRALAYSPNDRYPSAHAMALDLEAYLGNAIIHARRHLSGCVKDLFEKDRAQLQRVIEGVSKLESSIPMVSTMIATMSSATSLAPMPPSDASADGVALAPPSANVVIIPPKRRRIGALASAGAFALLAAAATFVIGLNAPSVRVSNGSSATAAMARMPSLVAADTLSLELPVTVRSQAGAFTGEPSAGTNVSAVGAEHAAPRHGGPAGRDGAPRTGASDSLFLTDAPVTHPPSATPASAPAKKSAAGKLSLDADDPWRARERAAERAAE